jgi:hypothetical protein
MGPAMTTDRKDERGKPGLLSRATARLARSESEVEARELQANTWRLGHTSIVDLADRSEASVCGAIRSVTLRPRVTAPALVVEIYDGSKALNLVWLGRRRIGGIVPGTYLTVHGRVTYRLGVPTIFNPAYEIRPDRGI